MCDHQNKNINSLWQFLTVFYVLVTLVILCGVDTQQKYRVNGYEMLKIYFE